MVAGLAVFFEDARGDVGELFVGRTQISDNRLMIFTTNLVNNLEDRVFINLVSKTEVLESGESRVRLAQNSVSVTRNNTARFQDFPELFLDLFV